MVALVAANLVPLAGVALLGWNAGALLLLYWLENGVIGAWNAPKMLLVQVEEKPESLLREYVGRLALILFFAAHYGIFWAGHGGFVLSLFVTPDPAAIEAVTSRWYLVGAVGLVASHGVSFAQNFIGRGEYRTVTVDELLWQPYRRVLALHVTLLFGVLIVEVLGSPVLGLLLLVVCKTGIDLRAHLKEHHRVSEGE